MEKLTYLELKELLEDDVPGEWLDSNLECYKDEIGQSECVSSGGFDNDSFYDSVQIFRVYHFKDHDIFIRFEGWFSSSGGTEFEKMIQVQPVEKTVTVYETI